MIFLMMIDTPEEKRKFVILYEKYRYLMQKVVSVIYGQGFACPTAVNGVNRNAADGKPCFFIN